MGVDYQIHRCSTVVEFRNVCLFKYWAFLHLLGLNNIQMCQYDN